VGIDELLGAYRGAVLEIASRHGARNVRIFGSTARGEATPASDVDVLVTMDKGRSLLDLCALGNELEDLLQRKVDVVTEPALSPHMRERILREALPL
jgi:uncharacterized protein